MIIFRKINFCLCDMILYHIAAAFLFKDIFFEYFS